MDDKQIRESLDACRPGSDDLREHELAELASCLPHSPELRAAFDRVQRLDDCIGRAMEDVPVPAELGERLLARVRQSQVELAPVRTSSRRKYLWAGSVIAASLLVAAAGLWYLQPGPIAGADVPQLADAWYQQMGGGWQSSPLPKTDLVVPRNDIVLQPQAWQHVDKVVGHRGIAYKFSIPGGGVAVLFVVKMTIDRAPTIPPQGPQPMTGNHSVAAWQSRGVTYLLVLHGDGRDYRHILKSIPNAPV